MKNRRFYFALVLQLALATCLVLTGGCQSDVRDTGETWTPDDSPKDSRDTDTNTRDTADGGPDTAETGDSESDTSPLDTNDTPDAPLDANAETGIDATDTLDAAPEAGDGTADTQPDGTDATDTTDTTRPPCLNEVHRAEQKLLEIARAAKKYFESKQKTCSWKMNCDEPWHHPPPSREKVPFAKKVFPGGTSAEVKSHPKAPTGGEYQTPNVKVPHSSTPETLKHLDNPTFGNRQCFQYVYRTGGLPGPEAKATITAVADLDRSTLTNQKTEVTVLVDDKNKNVIITAPKTEYRGR